MYYVAQQRKKYKISKLKKRMNTEFFKCIKITAEIKIIRTNKQHPPISARSLIKRNLLSLLQMKNYESYTGDMK